MIEGQYLALAEALAHGGTLLYELKFHCERCASSFFHVVKFEEKAECKDEDIVIEKTIVLICAQCGAVEGDAVTTIIPSWIYSPKYEHLRKKPLPEVLA